MYTLGIDIGSTTSKCAVLKDGEELVATSLRVGGMGTEGPQEALDDLWGGLRDSAGEEMGPHDWLTGLRPQELRGSRRRGQRADVPRDGRTVRLPGPSDGD